MCLAAAGNATGVGWLVGIGGFACAPVSPVTMVPLSPARFERRADLPPNAVGAWLRAGGALFPC